MPTACWELTADIPPPGRAQLHPYREVAERRVDGDVLEFGVGVINRQDNVDGLVLVIVLIVINQCKGRVHRRLALVEVVCERPEFRHDILQSSVLVLAGADLLDP